MRREDLVAATQCYRLREIRYAINRLFKKSRKILISACRKHVVAATGSSPFKVGDNQRPERTMSGVVRGAGWVFRPLGRLVVKGESGRNELLRGPFALFGVRIGMLSS